MLQILNLEQDSILHTWIFRMIEITVARLWPQFFSKNYFYKRKKKLKKFESRKNGPRKIGPQKNGPREKWSPEKWPREKWSPEKCPSKIILRQNNARKFKRLFHFYQLIPLHIQKDVRPFFRVPKNSYGFWKTNKFIWNGKKIGYLIIYWTINFVQIFL